MFKKISTYFTFESIFCALMAATTEAYALYYYSKIDSNLMNMGLLSTIPLLCGALVQYLLVNFRLKISNTIGIIFFQILQILGLILIVYNFFHPQLWSIFSGMILYWVGGQNCLPFWMDWTSHIFEFEDYGTFLRKRNKLVGFIILICFLASSYWLKLSNAFLYVFVIGLVARIISFITNLFLIKKSKIIISQKKDPVIPSAEVHEGIISKIIFPLSIFRLSVNLASPFFLPFMTQELALSPSRYAILTAAPFLSRIIVLGNWIELNKGGNPFQIIQICALGICVLPILWALNSDFIMLLGYQLLSGFLWSGMEFSSTLMIQNFTYGHSRFLLSKLNALNTFFTVVGAVLGGFLFKYNFDYTQVFSASTFLRFLSAIFLIYVLGTIPQTKLKLHLIRPILLGAVSLRPSHANAIKLFFGRKK